MKSSQRIRFQAGYIVAAMLSCSTSPLVRAQSDVPVLTIPQYSVPPGYVVPNYQPAVPTYPYGVLQPSIGIPSAPIDRTSHRPETNRTPQAGDFSITLRTDLMSAFVNRQSVESDNVATKVMEADVRGVQTTTTSVRLQSTNSSDKARLHIVSSGTVSSNTIGYTPQAQIASTGNHTFEVVKPVFFDGDRFLTKSAYGQLQVRQTPHTINTVASGIPLIGAIGRRVAWNQVQRRMPISDSIVARRVADDVLPRINSSVDSKLADLNRKWRKLHRQIDNVIGEGQLKWSASSTVQSFSATAINTAVATRSIDPSQQLLPGLEGPEAAAIVFSEDGLNEGLRRLPLNGQYFSDATLQQLVTAFRTANGDFAVIRHALADAVRQETPATLFGIRFGKETPLELRLEGGLVTIDARFRVVPPIGEPSQLQLVRIRIGGEDRGDGQWAIGIREISCEPADPNEAPDMWTTTINTQAKNILSGIPAATLPRQLNLQHVDPRIPVVRIHRIQAQNAQLRISCQLDDASGTDVVTRRPATQPPASERVRTFGPDSTR